MYENMPIITQIWHRAKCYFASMSNASYQINCTKSEKKNSPHSSLRYHTTQNVWKKLPQLLQFGTEPNSILHASAAHGTWSWYPIWRKSIQPPWTSCTRTARQTDWWMDGLTPFLHSPPSRARNNKKRMVYSNNTMYKKCGS